MLLPAVPAGVDNNPIEWATIVQAFGAIKHATRPDHVLAIGVIPVPNKPGFFGILALEAPRDAIDKGLVSILDNHNHAVVAQRVKGDRVAAIITAYVRKWAKAGSKAERCGCTTIKIAPKRARRALRPPKHAGDGCPRENTRRRQARRSDETSKEADHA